MIEYILRDFWALFSKKCSASRRMASEDTFLKRIFNGALDGITEMHALLPDSMLFGALLLYILTHNLSFGILAVFIFEMVLSHKFIGWMFAQTVGPEPRPPTSVKCRAGFKTAQLSIPRTFSHDQYPSYALFSITSIATYLGMSTKEFSTSLREMGPEWSPRITVAFVFIGLMIPILIASQMYRCDIAIGEIGIALGLAIVVGILLFVLNKAMFGREAMNFLGLPDTVSIIKEKDPIYVCTNTSG